MGPKDTFPRRSTFKTLPSLGLAQSWLQPCWQLRGAELNLPIHCSGHYSPECRSSCTARCPTVPHSCQLGLCQGLCTRLLKGSSPSLCLLWLSGQDQRYREGGALGHRRSRALPLTTPVQTGPAGSTARAGRKQNHLHIDGVGCPRLRGVSAIVLCFQTSFWELL